MNDGWFEYHVLRWQNGGSTHSQNQNNLNCDRLNHWTKGLKIIQSSILGITISNQMSLMSLETTIWFELNLVYSFTANGFSIRWDKYKRPSVISLQGIKLSLHCLLTHRMLRSLLVSGRLNHNGIWGSWSGEVIQFKLMNIMFRPSDHGVNVGGSRRPMYDETLWRNWHIRRTQWWYSRRMEIRRRKMGRKIKIRKEFCVGKGWRRE